MAANLFADHEPPSTGPYAGTPAPRRSHDVPPTSREAHDQHEGRGRAGSDRKLVLQLIREYPGSTACELHAAQGDRGTLTRHDVSRRAPELREAGLVRNGEEKVCSIARTKQMTWYAN